MKARAPWAVLPLAVALAVLWVLDPTLVLSPTTPTGGDLGLHVYPFSRGVERILSGRTPMGWDSGWFTGFPLFYFYFPLPAFLMAPLTPLLGFEVAFKVVAVSGLVALPFAAHFLARSVGLDSVESAFAGALGGAFVFMQSYWQLGGNIASTVVGEFAYSLSLTLAVVFVALVSRELRDPGSSPAPAAWVLGATALFHVLGTVIAVLASVPLLVRHRARRFVLLTWSLGFAVSAFWSLPFLARSGWMGHLRWNPATDLATLMPFELWFLLPAATLSAGRLRRVGWGAVPLLTGVALSAVLYVVPSGLEMRDRLLPFWFFGLHLLAGIGLGGALTALVSHRSRRAAVTFGTLAVLTGAVFVLRDAGALRRFAASNLEGYVDRETWPRYAYFLDALFELPPGRLAWQEDAILRQGPGLAPGLAPYWSSSHPTLYGALVESTPSAPFARRVIREISPEAPPTPLRGEGADPFDLPRGVRHLRMFGTRYMATFTPVGREAARASSDLVPRVSNPTVAVFEVPGVELVSAANRVPTVMDGPFGPAAEAWFNRDLRLDEWLVQDGPADWPRRSGDPADWPPAERIEVEAGGVSDVDAGDDWVEFRTAAVGVPHLVRVSMFPNWTAVGADGPWLAAPSLMVVVPRQERVRLEFRTTPVEWLGWLTTAVGVVWLIAFQIRGRRRGFPAEGRPAATEREQDRA